MQPAPIFTVGHSNRNLVTFLQLLRDNAIQVLVDVRSAPYSRYVPQFNKKELEAAVIEARLQYIFMGDVIGGKPSDPQYLNTNGKVLYDRIAATELFQQGLDRLIKGLDDGWVIALMCAEEDPFKCHRHHLIANELEMKRHIPVWHLRHDGSKIPAKKLFDQSTTQWKLF